MRPISAASIILISFLSLGCSLNSSTSDTAENSPQNSNSYKFLGDSHLSDFYTISDQTPLLKPGVLLRQEPLQEHQTIPGASKSIRLLYTSTSGIDDTSIVPVSGALFLPKGEAPEGGWPVILWSHGTVGIADICAPSWTGYIPMHDEYLERWINQGYAIVASDYQGLGTKGIHPYLATKPAALSNLDILRAAHMLNMPLSQKTVIVGQSQGAGAAIATAGYASSYAPEVSLLGVVATGTPLFTPNAIKIIQANRPTDVVDPMLGYNFLALTLVQQLEPDFNIEDYVSESALPTVKAVANTCNRGMRSEITKLGLTYNNAFKADPLEPLQIAFDQMMYPTLKLAVPLYVGSGDRDKDTPLRMQQRVVETACQSGSVVQAHVYEGFDHLTALNHSTIDSVSFVADLMSGKEVTGNCDNLPYK